MLNFEDKTMIIITPCGSGRFKEFIHALSARLEQMGFIVLTPPLHNIDKLTANSADECKLLAWKGATFAHLHRVGKGDVCLVINPTGYIGLSTTLELGYAVALGKLVVALQHDKAEPAREGLFDFVLETDDLETVAQKTFELLYTLKGQGMKK